MISLVNERRNKVYTRLLKIDVEMGISRISFATSDITHEDVVTMLQKVSSGSSS